MQNVRLINGDFMEVVRTIESESVDLIVTDPPYRVISGGTGSNLAQRFKGSDDAQRPTGILAKNDGKIFKFNDIIPDQYMPELYRVLRPGRDAYVMTNNITLQQLLEAAIAAGFKFHGVLAWIKNNCTPSRWYMKNIELTVYLYKPPARVINDKGSKQTFFADNPTSKVHPTEKPVSLMAHYIANSSERGWTVLDPFMGSGSTGVAAVQSGRRFIGIELDPEYFAVARGRLAEARSPNLDPLARLLHWNAAVASYRASQHV